MRTALIALAAFWMAAAPANAAVGSGEYDAGYPDVLAAIHAQPLSDLGDDAVRFSTTPQLGGRAWIVNRRPRLTPDRHAMLTPMAVAFAVARRRSA
jgi:hypothetical protein